MKMRFAVLVFIGSLMQLSPSAHAQNNDKDKKKAQAPAPQPRQNAPAPARPPTNNAPANNAPRPSSAPIRNNASGAPSAPIRNNAGAQPNNAASRPVPTNTGNSNVTRHSASPEPSFNSAPPRSSNAPLPSSNRPGAVTGNARAAAMNPEASGRVVENLNRQRLASNPNARPLPHGELIQRGGTYSIKTPSGREYETRRDGSLASFRGTNGEAAHFGAHGEVRSVHLASGATVLHGPGGSRIIRAERPDHTVIVSNRAGHGYIERPFVAHGQFYRQRVYALNGHSYVHAYRQYYFHGARAYYYVPAHYYSPGFYGWVGHPWLSPVRYRWGWNGTPWYGYYSGYFAPSPAYGTPSLWLTDYILSTSLQEAFQQQVDAGAEMASGDGGAIPLSPEVKRAIAGEVSLQLAAEQTEGQQIAQGNAEDPTTGGLPSMLNGEGPRVFITAGPLTVDTADGQSCALTGGDVLQLNDAPASDAPSASLQVLASKGADCQPGQMAMVSIPDLQEMQNHLRETLDAGLSSLREGQGGVGKLPPPPRTTLPGTINSPYADSAPPVDSNAASVISGEAQTDVQADQDVTKQAEDPQA